MDLGSAIYLRNLDVFTRKFNELNLVLLVKVKDHGVLQSLEVVLGA